MKAFTLIETLIVIGIFAIIMGAVFSAIVMVYKTHGYTWQQSLAIDEARRGIKIMAQEIREARPGDDGSFPIEKADDKEFIFYSDIDKDGAVERVRYFLGGVGSGQASQECVSFSKGGTCQVLFDDFYEGELISSQVTISTEGDFGWSQERADITVNTEPLGEICRNGCSDCAGDWQGTDVFDVTEEASTGTLQLWASASQSVDPFCDWIEQDHSMKVKFDLEWETEDLDQMHQFKKGVTNPVGNPVEYPDNQEEVTVITSYVRNVPPIFEYFYFDKDLDDFVKIEEYPAKLSDTELMKLYLVVNIDLSRAPQDYGLETYVQLRNLKD